MLGISGLVIFGNFFWPAKNLITDLVNLMFLSLSIVVWLFIEQYFKSGLFFTTDYLIINNKKDIKIKWDDLEVDQTGFSFTAFNNSFLKVYSKINPETTTEIELHWGNEKSLIRLVQKYVPTDNKLHKIISQYISHRRIKI
jgi:hypothetical protein